MAGRERKGDLTTTYNCFKGDRKTVAFLFYYAQPGHRSRFQPSRAGLRTTSTTTIATSKTVMAEIAPSEIAQ